MDFSLLKDSPRSVETIEKVGGSNIAKNREEEEKNRPWGCWGEGVSG